MTRPVIGLIVPPKGGGVPPECTALYGDAAEFLVADAALRALDLDGYAEAEARLPALARDLAAQGADAVVLMGTSMSFHRGRAHAETLADRIAAAANRPATTMSAAIAGALAAVGARRIALATAYIDEVNQALISYLGECGVEVASLASLDIREVAAIAEVESARLVALGLDAFRQDETVDALFISCGGLQTLDITRELEAATSRPVISSAVAGAWAAASVGGVDARRPDLGALLAGHAGLAPAFVRRPAVRA